MLIPGMKKSTCFVIEFLPSLGFLSRRDLTQPVESYLEIESFP